MFQIVCMLSVGVDETWLDKVVNQQTLDTDSSTCPFIVHAILLSRANSGYLDAPTELEALFSSVYRSL